MHLLLCSEWKFRAFKSAQTEWMYFNCSIRQIYFTTELHTHEAISFKTFSNINAFRFSEYILCVFTQVLMITKLVCVCVCVCVSVCQIKVTVEQLSWKSKLSRGFYWSRPNNSLPWLAGLFLSLCSCPVIDGAADQQCSSLSTKTGQHPAYSWQESCIKKLRAYN